MNTQTPRTDALARKPEHVENTWRDKFDAMTEMARQLERDLAAARAEVERLRKIGTAARAEMARLRKARTDAWAKLRPQIFDQEDRAERAEAEVTALRELIHDGFTVFSNVTDDEKRFVSPECVSAVLDAFKRAARAKGAT